MPTSPWRPRQVRDKPVTSGPLVQIPLRRRPWSFPGRGSFQEVGVMEFLYGCMPATARIKATLTPPLARRQLASLPPGVLALRQRREASVGSMACGGGTPVIVGMPAFKRRRRTFNYRTRKPSCSWQTRATLLKSGSWVTQGHRQW